MVAQMSNWNIYQEEVFVGLRLTWKLLERLQVQMKLWSLKEVLELEGPRFIFQDFKFFKDR